MVSLTPALVESSLSLGQEKYAMRETEGQNLGEPESTQIATRRCLPVTRGLPLVCNLKVVTVLVL
jgi:hypothetical protein